MNLKVFIFLMGIAVASQAARIANLYTDNRAMSEGDLLTVLIVENAKAGSNSTTKTDTKNSVGAKMLKGSGAFSAIPSFGASGEMGAAFEGKGDTHREGNLVAKLSVRIDKVYDNGNLLISGDKIVEINQEKEIIRLTGLVRPQDIESGNTIYSYNIANAEITYSGHGEAADASRAGPIARFFNWLF